MRSSIGIAACLAIALVTWFVVSTAAPQPLYAQAIKAAEKARTVHLVGRQRRDGKWAKEVEALYERAVGVAEYHYRGGKTVFRIDDGKHCWRKAGDGPVVQSRSAGLALTGIIAKLFRTTVGKIEAHYTRDRTGDKAIDGVKCRLYVRRRPDGSTRKRIWIDNAGRLRRYELQRSADGGWETCSEVTVRYDVPIDSSRFQPPIPADVTVMDAVKAIEKRFSLSDAAFFTEVMGLAFAVHDIQRCDNGMIYVVCSLRPTAATIEKLGAIRSEDTGVADIVYGDFQLSSSWKRVDGKERSYQVVRLGKACHDGLQVQWVLLHPRGEWPKGTNTCELSAYIHTRGKLHQHRQQAGQKWWRRYRPLVVLPLPPEAVPLKKIIEGVYAQAVSLEPLPGNVYLKEASRLGRDGNWSYRLRRPSEMTSEEFLGQVMLEFERLEAMRQESKRKTKAAKTGG